MSPARFAVAVAVLLTVPVVRGAETLKWAPKPGETLRYTLSQAFEVKVTLQGQEVSQKHELEADLTWKVVAVVPDGPIDLAMTLDRARINSTAPGRVLVYDTQDKNAAEAPANEPFVKAYEALVGKPYVIRLSPQGEVLDARLPEGAAAALAGSPLAAVADAGSFYSPAGVKNMLAQVVPRLPREPVERGATWDSDLSVPGGPMLKTVLLKFKYALAALKPLAAIDATLDTSVTAAPEAGISVKVTKQRGTARFAFDQAAGHLDSATIQQSVEMTVNDGSGDRAQTTVATLTFKLKR